MKKNAKGNFIVARSRNAMIIGFILFLSIAVILTYVAVTADPIDPVTLVIAFIFYLFVINNLRLLITAEPLLEISSEGVVQENGNIIPWSEIESIEVIERVNSARKMTVKTYALAIFVKDTDKYTSHWSKVRKIAVNALKKDGRLPVVEVNLGKEEKTRALEKEVKEIVESFKR
ncbi:MAG TPA: hypothetical protein VGA67_03680 [Candidatus Dojkabacteria bacterium]